MTKSTCFGNHYVITVCYDQQKWGKGYIIPKSNNTVTVDITPQIMILLIILVDMILQSHNLRLLGYMLLYNTCMYLIQVAHEFRPFCLYADPIT